MIYPQLVESNQQDSNNDVEIRFICQCLRFNCDKLITYREWVDNQGYCTKHAVELGKIW